jgi:hypothetical protein
VHRARIAADAEPAQQQRDARARLAAAEHHRIIGGAVAREQLVGLEFAGGGRQPVHGRQLVEGHAHHAGADDAAPALGGLRGRADAGIAQRLLAAQRKAMARLGTRGLRSPITRSASKPLTSAAMRVGKRRQAANERRTLRAARSESRSTRRRCRPA